MEDLKHRLIKSSFVSYLGAKGNDSDNLFYHESWVMWVVEFLTQEYNIMERLHNHFKLGIPSFVMNFNKGGLADLWGIADLHTVVIT